MKSEQLYCFFRPSQRRGQSCPTLRLKRDSQDENRVESNRRRRRGNYQSVPDTLIPIWDFWDFNRESRKGRDEGN